MVWFYLTELMDEPLTKTLSIPLWSDFIPVIYYHVYNNSHFQSHYGLILSCRLAFVIKSPLPFQSHYGLILSLKTAGTTYTSHTHPFNPTMVWFYLAEALLEQETRVLLSIPLWSDFILKFAKKALLEPHDFQSHYGLILSRRSGETNR